MGNRNTISNRVLVQTTTTGTGTYSIGTAVTGYVDFAGATAPAFTSGDRVPYLAVDSLTAPTIWELGEGVATAGSPWTLARTTIRASSNAGSAVNWSSGTKFILVTPAADRLAVLDDTGWLWLDPKGSNAIGILAEAAGIALSTPTRGVRAKNTAKAWGVFDGTTLNNSFGISSVTDYGTGDVTFNFTTAFSSNLYAIVGTASLINSDGAITTFQPRADTSQISATSCRMICSFDATAAGRTLIDAAYMSVVFFGDQ